MIFKKCSRYRRICRGRFDDFVGVFFSGIKLTKTDLMQWKLSAISYISGKIHDFKRYYGEWFKKEKKNRRRTRMRKR